MRYDRIVHATLSASLALIPFNNSSGRLNTSEDKCDRTAGLRIYSNAAYIEEAGDVVGYELALQAPDGKSVSALLYIYEGQPNEDSISLSGKFSGRKLTMEGEWVLRLTEEPSKKEITETRHVRIDGTLDSTWFRGSIKIEGLDKVRLKRVTHIWGCRNSFKSR